MKAERILPLDSLRGIAALGVSLFWHYSHFGPYRPFEGLAVRWVYHYGLMLVDLFFVLSGFVLGHAYLKKLSERQVGPFRFFILRFSRLYPLHLLTLCLVAGLQFYRSTHGLRPFIYKANDSYHFLLNLAFIQQGIIRTGYSFNGPSWSLTVEELSYLLYFVSLYFFAARRKLAFGFLLLLGISINLLGGDTHILNLFVSRGLVGFFSGCLAYQVHRYAERKQRSLHLAGGSALLLFAVVFYFVREGYPRSAPTLLVHSMVIFPALVLLVLNTAPLTRVFSIRPLAYLGKISYSVYMFHFPVQLLLVTADEAYELHFARASIPFFLLYSTLTLTASVASFHLFERRAQAAIRGFFLSSEPAQPPSEA